MGSHDTIHQKLSEVALALQFFTGFTLYQKTTESISGYPVGPTMFIVGAPLFPILQHLVGSDKLPEWLFYTHFHGVTNPALAIIGAGIGMFVIPTSWGLRG